MVPDRREWREEVPEVQVKRWLETGQFDSADDLLVEEIVVGHRKAGQGSKRGMQLLQGLVGG